MIKMSLESRKRRKRKMTHNDILLCTIGANQNFKSQFQLKNILAKLEYSVASHLF